MREAVGTKLRMTAGSLYTALRAGLATLAIFSGILAMSPRAEAADPAVVAMDRIAKDLIAASRTRSQGAMAGVINRHADLGGIGMYALGDYRPRLDPNDRGPYFAGMVRFLSRYAATEAPKYPIANIKFAQESRKAKYGLMVDSTVTLQDGTSYEVSWLMVPSGGGSYRVRDAQVLGFWMTPFLKKLFEEYVAQHNGNVKALVAVLTRN